MKLPTGSQIQRLESKLTFFLKCDKIFSYSIASMKSSLESQTIDLSSSTHIWRGLASLTVFATAFSMVIAFLALKLTTTGNPDALLLEQEVYANFILFSGITPALVCPLVAYTLLIKVRDLNLTRAELDLMARKDSLTGLLNRRGFDDAAGRLILQARSDRKPVCALMCDIDLFKQVNDTYGHEGGDEAIRSVADILAKTLERIPELVVGRQGGDEFAILMMGKSLRELAHVADCIRQAVELEPVSWREEKFFLTISLGVSISASEDASVTSLLSRADRALYEAKKRGRNRVQVAALADAA